MEEFNFPKIKKTICDFLSEEDGSMTRKKVALRKNLCKFNNSDKKRYCERLEKQPLNFFTVYNKYRNLSSFSNSQSAEMERSGMEAD